MRTVTFKKNDGEIEDFVTNLLSFQLDTEDPFGVAYRSQCSSILPQSELDEFWSYVDSLLVEHPTPDFHSVWRIVENGITFGYEN